MAKTGIGEHTKTIALAVELDIPECYAVGVLECFWQFVAREAPDGDVSAHKPALVARRIRYPGSGEALFAALLAAGFLDLTPDGRTVVHDWSEHANDSVHTMLYRAVRRFSDGEKPKPGKVGREEKDRLEALWTAVSRRTDGNPPASDDAPAGNPEEADSEDTGTRRVPDGNPTIPNPSLPDQALVTEPSAPSREPFEIVKATLERVNAALNAPSPTDKAVRGWLAENRGLLPLAQEFGPEEAAALYLWAVRHFQGGRSWKVLYEERYALRRQMQEGVEFVPRTGGTTSGKAGGKQTLIEQMEEAAHG